MDSTDKHRKVLLLRPTLTLHFFEKHYGIFAGNVHDASGFLESRRAYSVSGSYVATCHASQE